MKYTAQHAARALEIVERLLPHVSPRAEYSDLVAILQTPSRWKEAHEQFSKIRVGISLPAEKTPDWSLERLFTRVAENAAKTAYNCSGAPAPFDQTSFDRLLQAEAEFLERKKNEANQSSQPTSLTRRGLSSNDRRKNVMSPALAQVLEKIREADLPAFAGVELSGADVRDSGYGESLLHVVAIWGDVDSARILIEEGATVDVPGEHGCTALHEAALQGHVEVAKLLLASGADRKLKSQFGDFSEIASRSENPKLRELAKS